MSKELLQQALEALESLFSGEPDDENRAKLCSDAAAALRAAIAAQPAREWVGLISALEPFEKLFMSFQAQHDGPLPTSFEAIIRTEDARKIAYAAADLRLFATYCPFCGVKLKEQS